MRLRRLRAAVFGPHRDRDLDLDAGVVLVYGRNESGKSCFREAVETVLYGFEPAKRETHPLALWNEGRGGDLHVEADLFLDDGSLLRVERVLQATGVRPEQAWMVGDSPSDIEAARAAGVRSALVFPRDRCELCPLRGGPTVRPDLAGARLDELARAIIEADASA